MQPVYHRAAEPYAGQSLPVSVERDAVHLFADSGERLTLRSNAGAVPRRVMA